MFDLNVDLFSIVLLIFYCFVKRHVFVLSGVAPKFLLWLLNLCCRSQKALSAFISNGIRKVMS